jgi:hypothetical protein
MNCAAPIANNLAFLNGFTSLTAVNIASQSTAWTINGSFTGTPAVNNGLVYVISGSQVEILNANTGTSVGTLQTSDSGLTGQPVLAGDSLIVSSSSNTYLFNLQTGALVQTIPYGGPVSVAGGQLYLAGSDGVLRVYRSNAVNVAFSSAGAVGLSAYGYTATGQTLSGTLGFAPAAGAVLTVINNTSSSPIAGTFTNLPDGGNINLTFGGTNYAFTASYSGGVGNDLTLTCLGAPPQAPVITNRPPPANATVGYSYIFAYQVSGYPAPTFAVTSGALPPGLALSSDGVISGRSTQSGTYSGTVTASNGVSPAATQNFSIIVGQTPPVSNGPAITAQPTDQVVTTGVSASFSVTASGSPTPTYQWQVSADGGTTWINLTDTAPYSGTATSTLMVAGTTTAMNGLQYQCVITTGASSTASLPATLVVMGLSDQAFLHRLFQDVLGRPIDPGAAASFGAALLGGESRTAVLNSLLESNEYSLRQIEPVIRLYYAALARCPDYAGLQNWSNALQGGQLTLAGAGDQFAGSAEFLLKYGNLDNTGYVQQLYRNVLGREADPAGLADWVGQLNSGSSRGKVLIGFSESPEFQADMANQVEVVRLYCLLLKRMPTTTELPDWIRFLNGDDQTDTLLTLGCPAGLSNECYVQAVFEGFLCRSADPGALSAFTAGLASGTVTHSGLVDTLLNSSEFGAYVGPVSRLYLAAFNRIPDQPGLVNWVSYAEAGNSLQSVADTFTASQEFTNRYGAMSDTGYVTALYQNVLGRTPDPAGLAYWTGLLASGTSRGGVLIGFSQSPEGINLFAPTLRTFLHYFTFLDTAPTQADLDYWNAYLTTLDDQLRGDLLSDPTFANGS